MRISNISKNMIINLGVLYGFLKYQINLYIELLNIPIKNIQTILFYIFLKKNDKTHNFGIDILVNTEKTSWIIKSLVYWTKSPIKTQKLVGKLEFSKKNPVSLSKYPNKQPIFLKIQKKNYWFRDILIKL